MNQDGSAQVSGGAGGRAIAVAGWGAVSPGGWSAAELLDALLAGGAGLPAPAPLALGSFRPGIQARRVPRPANPPPELRHPRLRRASDITRFGVAAGLEALGTGRRARVAAGDLRLGLVFAVMDGCVAYSARFFGEVLAGPALASPILFPETVFNAPAAHLAAVLGSTGPNDTLVGGPAGFVAALSHAAGWLCDNRADGVLVVGAEEADPLTAGAVGLFAPGAVVAEGAGALYLEPADGQPDIELVAATDVANTGCGGAAASVRRELLGDRPPDDSSLLVDSRQGNPRPDAADDAAWHDWGSRPRLSPREIFGDSLGARAAWQCAAAAEWLSRAPARAEAIVSATGNHGQAAGVRMRRNGSGRTP
jgi:hypothetical protein